MDRRTRRGVTALFVAGLAAQVLVWVFLVAPFGGIDEWDHAYRASSVAHGDLVAPPGVVTRGGGALIRVDPQVVDAAQPQCLAKRYTTAADCRPGAPAGDGTVLMPSGAGRYSPVYYLAVGWLGRALAGDAGLLAQRLLAGGLCLLLTAAAAVLVLGGRRPAAGLFALTVAVTPITVYSFATNAPNGPEMAAGLLWWAALIALAVERRRGRAPWTALAVAGVLLGTVRPLGPVWMAGSLAAVAVGVGLRRAARVLRRPSRTLLATAGVVVLAAVAGIGWTLSQQVLERPQEVVASPGGSSLAEGAWYATWTAPLTLIETVTENPGRGLPPPPLLVAGWAVAFVMLAIRGAGLLRHRATDAGPADSRPTDRDLARLRRAALLLLGLVIGLGWLVQTLTYTTRAWQGRYELPLAVGVPLLLGACAVSRRYLIPDAVVIGVATTVAQVAAVDFSLSFLAVKDPAFRSGAWTPDVAALWAGSILGGLLVTAALVLAAARDARSRQHGTPDDGALGLQRLPSPLSQETV